eukprot:GFYU01030555.1.p2 GENE.GFYU01030555.1~~GFYU01030555.1.p2  ORF type:complete len:185 (-),score=51.34 GFYU01030555.1:105-659(-)
MDLVTLVRVAQTIKRRHYKKKEFVVKEDEDPDKMYIVKKGIAVVLKATTLDTVDVQTSYTVNQKGLPSKVITRTPRSERKMMKIAEVRATQYFGEYGFLRKTRRTASVMAITALTVYTLPKNEFFHLLSSNERRKFATYAEKYLGEAEIKRLHREKMRWKHQKKKIIEESAPRALSMSQNLKAK